MKSLFVNGVTLRKAGADCTTVLRVDLSSRAVDTNCLFLGKTIPAMTFRAGPKHRRLFAVGPLAYSALHINGTLDVNRLSVKYRTESPIEEAFLHRPSGSDRWRAGHYYKELLVEKVREMDASSKVTPMWKSRLIESVKKLSETEVKYGEAAQAYISEWFEEFHFLSSHGKTIPKLSRFWEDLLARTKSTLDPDVQRQILDSIHKYKNGDHNCSTNTMLNAIDLLHERQFIRPLQAEALGLIRDGGEVDPQLPLGSLEARQLLVFGNFCSFLSQIADSDFCRSPMESEHRPYFDPLECLLQYGPSSLLYALENLADQYERLEPVQKLIANLEEHPLLRNIQQEYLSYRPWPPEVVTLLQERLLSLIAPPKKWVQRAEGPAPLSAPSASSLAASVESAEASTLDSDATETMRLITPNASPAAQQAFAVVEKLWFTRKLWESLRFARQASAAEARCLRRTVSMWKSTFAWANIAVEEQPLENELQTPLHAALGKISFSQIAR